MMQWPRRTKSGPVARWLARWRSRRDRRARGARLYAAAVRRARSPRFYREFGVPDTPEARFEMVTVQVVLFVRALRRLREARLAQDLVDAFFTDVDRNLREMGVGDLAVGRRVRRLAAAYLARAQDLGAALDAGSEPAVAEVLARHFGDRRPGEEGLRGLARHFLEEDRRLCRAPQALLAEVFADALPAN